MVAAICITGVIIYFFFWSIGHRKRQYQEWISLGEEEEREQIRGQVTRVLTQKKRFSGQYWLMEIEGKLYLPKEKTTLDFLWRKPLTPELNLPSIEKNQEVVLIGHRRQQAFYANQITHP